MTERKTRSRLTGGIIAVIVLAVCLVVTTVALAYSIASVRDNTFATGGVRINLNDGEPVIRPDEFLFEPGMTVKKDFFIENDSTARCTTGCTSPVSPAIWRMCWRSR